MYTRILQHYRGLLAARHILWSLNLLRIKVLFTAGFVGIYCSGAGTAESVKMKIKVGYDIAMNKFEGKAWLSTVSNTEMHLHVKARTDTIMT